MMSKLSEQIAEANKQKESVAKDQTASKGEDSTFLEETKEKDSNPLQGKPNEGPAGAIQTGPETSQADSAPTQLPEIVLDEAAQAELDKLTKNLDKIAAAEASQESTPVGKTVEQYVQPVRVIAVDDPPKGSYRAVRLAQVVKQRGEKVKPNEYGYYTDPDKETKELLEFYAKQGLVEKV